MLVVLGCVIAMIAWQALITKLYPPKPKAIKVTNEIVTSNAAPATATETPAEKPVEAAKETAAASAEPRSPEQIVALTNEFVRMEFTTWGGGVSSVELLKHKVNGSGNVVLNGTNLSRRWP